MGGVGWGGATVWSPKGRHHDSLGPICLRNTGGRRGAYCPPPRPREVSSETFGGARTSSRGEIDRGTRMVLWVGQGCQNPLTTSQSPWQLPGGEMSLETPPKPGHLGSAFSWEHRCRTDPHRWETKIFGDTDVHRRHPPALSRGPCSSSGGGGGVLPGLNPVRRFGVPVSQSPREWPSQSNCLLPTHPP